MPLLAVVDKLDGLSDDIKKLYKLIDAEDDSNKGKYILDVQATSGVSIANVDGLRKALDSERSSVKDLKGKLAEFGEMSPAEAKEALQKMSEMDNWDEAKKLEELKAKFQKDIEGKASAERKALIEKFNKEQAELKELAESSTAQLHKVLVESQALKAISATGANPEIMYRLIKDNLKLVDGEVRVVDDKGVELNSPKNNYEQKMGINEYVESLKSNDAYKPFFPANVKSGGATNVVKGVVTKVENVNTVSSKQKIAEGLKEVSSKT